MSRILTHALWVSVRVSADEDGEAEAQHLHHQMLAVDHCDRANLSRGHTRGEVSGTAQHRNEREGGGAFSKCQEKC